MYDILMFAGQLIFYIFLLYVAFVAIVLIFGDE